MKRADGRKRGHVARAVSPEAKWTVVFERDGLEPHDVRMIEELIAGNFGIARLLVAGASSEDSEHAVAETVRDALVADFPNVTFRVERLD